MLCSTIIHAQQAGSNGHKHHRQADTGQKGDSTYNHLGLDSNTSLVMLALCGECNGDLLCGDLDQTP